MPARKKPEDPREYKVGDHVLVSLSGGRMVDGTVMSIIRRTDGVLLQVAYGTDQTALVRLYQVRPLNKSSI